MQTCSNTRAIISADFLRQSRALFVFFVWVAPIYACKCGRSHAHVCTFGVHLFTCSQSNDVVVVVVDVIIILVVVVVVIDVVGHSKSFLPQKERFSSFENNMGQTDGRTDGHDLL